ncbi:MULTISPECIES: LysR family transcriptional regulator [Variovorax]|jgi:DNA-binding transcriptional LysR family regulator|uniref:LysR family transcriptional regulator n=1 Tax=Variovorax TaxID=34072 RepID=UPI00086B8480|nr:MULTISPECIES: LysR family transcriptional regulator [Variovorax]MBN8753207.1 LysR family transcriptional regulator [Variovorax sp.]ODU11520.1 MAG: LysR family transcriptional regulator [Variovorax sp. SCN 67-85]ODV27293.1 MAG: LysR family transcriptional regulator [Variovorax sp. SCN 67-20]OJZ11984.1 MAG: LysR family transcriptional regulator [Variovorax sp. 67-131]UKI05408.1 LysR family transcriptional regulator [Variovorax paradoxus]
MPRENINDILAFLAVARERSFTRAAARLGVSQSALSHTVRGLEARMGIRLLTRTTRSVSPTDAGERLLNTVGPRFEEIEAELSALAELRDKPAGTIRITTTDYAADAVLWPRLSRVLPDYPDLKIEMIVDYGLADIVADRYDIGVRFGDQVAKDMIAVRIGPDELMVIVGAPSYLAKHAAPKKPQDLLAHNCITLRLPTRGGLYAWELRKGKRELQVRVDGQLTCNGAYQMINAALDGAGLAFVPESMVRHHLAERRLQCVMGDWCPTFPGLHIFYASRRESSRAMAVVIDALRYRP